MNWQVIHNIFDVLSRQHSARQLNNMAISFCCDFLAGSTYRIYIMEQVPGGYLLDVLAYEGSAKPTEFETNYTGEISKTGRIKTPFFEKDGFGFFSVAANKRCQALLVVDIKTNAIPTSNYEILKTVVSVWQNQLGSLHHFQRDYLTDLYNREYFLDTLNRDNFGPHHFQDRNNNSRTLQSRDPRRQRNFVESNAIVLIDIQNFDKINQEFGYSIGDENLIALANLITLSFRHNDINCRYEGDIFAVIIQSVTRSVVEDILKRFLEQVKNVHFPVVGALSVKVGFSFVYEGLLATELIDQAKRALHQCKQENQPYLAYKAEHSDPLVEGGVKIGDIEFFDSDEN